MPIALEKFIRNSECLVVFRDMDEQLSIGSIQLNELQSPLIAYLEKAIDDYNRSREEQKASTITGAPRVIE